MQCPKCRQMITVGEEDRYCPKCGFQFNAPTEDDSHLLKTFRFDAGMKSIEVNGIRQGRVRSMSLIISADSKEAVLTLSKDEVFKSRI